MLRKYVYHEYYESWDPSFLAKPEVFRTHLGDIFIHGYIDSTLKARGDRPLC